MRKQTIILLVVMGAALLLSSGVALAKFVSCKPDAEKCKGTKKDDVLFGTSTPDRIFGLKGDDQLVGFGESDELFGGKGGDLLMGGGGDQADDTLNGEAGADFYVFENAWGEDVITDTAVADEDPVTGNMVIFSNVTGELIVNLNSDSGSAPEATDGVNTVNWGCPEDQEPGCDPNVIDRVRVFGSGNDRVTGNSAANSFFILDESGNDTLSGGEGNDQIENGDESGIDTVSGGEGNDEIESLGSDTDDGTDTSGGNDIVSGEAGDDTIDVKDGFGGDTVDCGEGTDTVFFDPPVPGGDPGDILLNPDACENQNP